MRKRYCRRFTKRLEVTFSSGGSKYRGISSDLSAGGLFIRTQNGLTPGNVIDIEIYLPEEKVCHLKGVVRRTVKTSFSLVKNGMGIELIERDSTYLDFLKAFVIDTEPEEVAAARPPEERNPEEKAGEPKIEEVSDMAPEFILIACENCKVKNRVRKDRLPFEPKCGKCGAVLDTRDIS